MSEASKQTECVDERRLRCPSGTSDDRGARVFAVVAGTADEPRIAFLNTPVLLEDVRDSVPPDLDPADVFRLEAPCARSACQHYGHGHCQLATHIATKLPAVTRALPACAIRADCRWYHEHGADACMRCPAVMTRVYTPPHDLPQGKGKRQLPVI